MSQCEPSDLRNGSSVAWELVCFLLRLIILPKAFFSLNLRGVWGKQNSWRRFSHTVRRVRRVEVEVLFCWWEAEQRSSDSGFSDIQFIWQTSVRSEEEEGIVFSVGGWQLFSGVTPQESWMQHRRWEVCGWVSVPCVPRGKTVPRSRHRQPLSYYWCLWQGKQPIFYLCWLALRKTSRTDIKRYQPAVVSFPHPRTVWGLMRSPVKVSLVNAVYSFNALWKRYKSITAKTVKILWEHLSCPNPIYVFTLFWIQVHVVFPLKLMKIFKNKCPISQC